MTASACCERRSALARENDLGRELRGVAAIETTKRRRAGRGGFERGEGELGPGTARQVWARQCGGCPPLPLQALRLRGDFIAAGAETPMTRGRACRLFQKWQNATP